MKIDISAIIDFIVVTVLFKYIILHWLTDMIVRVFKFVVIRTKDEAITWYHYSEGARGHGHTAATPYLCDDGICRQIKKEPQA
jgi:hypothetical protein